MSSVPYPNPQAIFYQQYEAARRDEIVGILLALFLGTFGIHQFYLRRLGLGILYCCFCWTSIPTLLGIIECFFMAGRVREFNALQAAAIAASLGIPVPGWDQQHPNVTAAPPTPPPPSNVYSGPSPVTAPGAPAESAFAPAVCPRCQAPNPAGSRFCAACGNPLT